MKILYVNHYGKTISGAERVMLNMAAGLKRRHGVDITALCPGGKLKEEFDALDIPVEEVEFVKFKRTVNPAFWLSVAGAAAQLRSKLSSLLASGKYDVLFSNSFVGHLYAGRAARRAGVPTVWHMHDILKPIAVNERIVPFASKNATLAISVSDAVKRNLVERGAQEKKIFTVLNGIDLEAFDKRAEKGLDFPLPAKDLEEMYVTLVGQIGYFKGQHTFIEAAVGLLKEKKLPLKFVIVGDVQDEADRKYFNELKETVGREGLDQKIVFAGYRTDIPAVLRASDILVHASATPDPCPMAVLEYLYSGKPVIGSATGGVPELISHGENGLLFKPGNAEELSERIASLANDKEKCIGMGAAARKRMKEHHTLEIQTDRVYELLEKAAATRR